MMLNAVIFMSKKKVGLELIKKPTKVLFLKDHFRQCLALEVVMCHKNAKDCAITDPGFPPNHIYCCKDSRV